MPLPDKPQIIFGWILCAFCIGLAVLGFADGHVVGGIVVLVAAAIAALEAERIRRRPPRPWPRRRDAPGGQSGRRRR